MDCTNLRLCSLPYGVTQINEGTFKGCSSLEEIEIPSSVKTIEKETFMDCTNLRECELSYKLTTLGDGFFRGCSNLSKVVMWEQLTYIPDYLFYGCGKLQEFVINYTITDIGSYAFYDTGLTKIVIPDSVESIGEKALESSYLKEISVIDNNANFSGQNGILYNKAKTSIVCVPLGLEGDIILPTALTSIPADGFRGRKIDSITIPYTLKDLGSNAFTGCSNLTIYVETATAKLSGWNSLWNASNRPVFWGCVLSSDKSYVVRFNKTSSSISNSSASGGLSNPYREGYKFEGWATSSGGTPVYTNSNVSTAPNNITLHTIWTDILTANFDFTLINSNSAYEIAVKAAATLIGDITIPSVYKGLPVSRIADYGFWDDAYYNAYARTNGITSVYIPNSITTIGESAFNQCTGLISVTFDPNSKLEYIADSAFSSCINLDKITIPSNVTHIGHLAFYDCKLSDFSFEAESKLISIGISAFDSCYGLTSIEIPDSVTEIMESAFVKCQALKSVKLPNALKYIRAALFDSCINLEDINIPSTVTSIGDSAFYDCNLKNLSISASVTYIGSLAFAFCGFDTITADNSSKYYMSSNNCLIRLSDGALIYGSNSTTSIPSSIMKIESYAFSSCKNLESVIIPKRVTSIGDYAFSGCTSLANVYYETNCEVTTIGRYAFYGCSSLELFIITYGVNYIGSYAFYNCKKLSTVFFNNSDGWWVALSDTATSGTSVSNYIISDPNIAATYLRENYSSRFWRRG
ncbi:MAG: leucine-rich repeat protein [Clostridiales bacterium]|nr:leucine-rich repeat protein [Clostridiales bacterium]